MSAGKIVLVNNDDFEIVKTQMSFTWHTYNNFFPCKTLFPISFHAKVKTSYLDYILGEADIYFCITSCHSHFRLWNIIDLYIVTMSRERIMLLLIDK